MAVLNDAASSGSVLRWSKNAAPNACSNVVPSVRTASSSRCHAVTMTGSVNTRAKVLKEPCPVDRSIIPAGVRAKRSASLSTASPSAVAARSSRCIVPDGVWHAAATSAAEHSPSPRASATPSLTHAPTT
jgi:hypothetical protein